MPRSAREIIHKILNKARQATSLCDIPCLGSARPLLLAFLEAPQPSLSREQLLQATRIHEDVFDRAIDVQVLRLRRKLEVDPSAPQLIGTERGFGYIFTLPVERA